MVGRLVVGRLVVGRLVVDRLMLGRRIGLGAAELRGLVEEVTLEVAVLRGQGFSSGSNFFYLILLKLFLARFPECTLSANKMQCLKTPCNLR